MNDLSSFRFPYDPTVVNIGKCSYLKRMFTPVLIFAILHIYQLDRV